MLVGASIDPYSIQLSSDRMPGRAKGPFDKAMKALDAHKFDEGISLLKTVVAGCAKKFAEGWHALGVAEDRTGKFAEARDAYTHAMEADPQLLNTYVTLARLCIRMKDWQCALQTAHEDLIKAGSPAESSLRFISTRRWRSTG